jgi:protease IV
MRLSRLHALRSYDLSDQFSFVTTRLLLAASLALLLTGGPQMSLRAEETATAVKDQPAATAAEKAETVADSGTAEKAKDQGAEKEAKSPIQKADKKQASDGAKKAKPKKVRLAHIAIEGQLPESAGSMSIFGDLGLDLRKTIERIDKVATDDSVEGMILEVGNAALERGKLHELSAAITRVRASGKKVIAQLESAAGAQYLLASACDQVVMPESGMVLVPGVHAQFSYYKDLMTKLGVEADFIHVGAFKGAAEPLTRNSMSESVRENMTAMIDDIYDQMLTTIANNRQLRVEEVAAAIDTGLFTAHEAQTAGLIDRVLYPDALRQELKDEFDADQLVYVSNYDKKKVDTDFSGPMGMVKLFQTMLGSGRSGAGSKGPKIALVYAVGPIMSGKSQNDAFGGQSMGSTTIVKALREAAKDDTVKAIVLRVNSPGGSALASDLIWRTTQSIDKPIVASMGDVAASGGYYISMGADKIVAEPGTITGSIGVVGGKLTLSGLYGKIGIATEVIQRGKNSGIFSTTNGFSASERVAIQGMMQAIYKQFTTKAATGRELPIERLEELAGGQVYTGRVAKRLGLVDETGTLKDAIRIAKQLAGIDPDEKVHLKVLPKPVNPLEAMFGANLDEEKEVRIAWGALQKMAPLLSQPLRQAVGLQTILREPVALVMPYWVEIR